MPAPTPPPWQPDALHPLVDGQQAPAYAPPVQPTDPQAQAMVHAWQQQRALLRQLHQDVLDEPIPARMAALVAHPPAAANARRWLATAALVLLSFALGWWGHGAWIPGADSGTALAQAPAANGFVRQARFAHTTYVPEQRHPVDVGATQEQHLVQWLSKRLGHPVRVPQLQAQGFALVGGRLLPGDAGMRAQFMYEHANGQRLTLYLGALEHPDAQAQQSAFQFSQDKGVAQFYWVDQGWGYALSAPLERAALLPLAQAVYQQLQ